ncbi:MAG TPA: hypothetical protein VHO94_04435 [Oscillospiraceae bacterium]|nr:hypothetical protein [Oscillospiraceae bacterium]
MKQKNELHLSVGTSSILMIFVVLCLTTFGVLSYVTANADYKLSQKNADAVTAYYKADTKANELLKTIDSQLLLADESAVYFETGTGTSEIPHVEQFRQKSEFSQITALLKEKEKVPAQKAAQAYRLFAYLLLSGRNDISVQKPDFTAVDSGIKVNYTVPVSSSQQLEVTVTVGKFGDKTRCKITSYKLTSTLEAGEDTHIQVWNGE